MLTANDLTAMREAVAGLFPDTCNLLTLTYTRDGYGGQVETWGTISVNIPCRLDILSGSKAVAAGVLAFFNTYVFSMPYDTVIDALMRVEHNGNTYSINSINEDVSWSIVKRVSVAGV